VPIDSFAKAKRGDKVPKSIKVQADLRRNFISRRKFFPYSQSRVPVSLEKCDQLPKSAWEQEELSDEEEGTAREDR